MPDREPLRLQARPCVDTTRLSTPLHRIAREYDDRSLGVGLNASAPSLVRRPPALHGSRGTSAPKQQRIGPLTLTRTASVFPPGAGAGSTRVRRAATSIALHHRKESSCSPLVRSPHSSSTSPFAATSIPRRDPGPDDVDLEILYCGVCHSDLHMVRNEWAGWPTIYPIVPGHEIVGRVRKVGANVTSVKAGDMAAVGCMVGSCRTCGSCKDGLEQYCDTGGTIFTYNSVDPDGTAPVTYGGYSDGIVVNSHFVLRVSPKLDPAAASPLLCAGITLYSPLKHWGAGPGKKVGHRRPRRPRPHGREVRARVRRAHGAVHDVAVEDRGRQAPRRGRRRRSRRTPTRWRSTRAAST